MENLAKIKDYKKGQALKGFRGLPLTKKDDLGDLGIWEAVAKGIEDEIEQLKKSLREKKHSTSKSSLTLEQSIFSDMDIKQVGEDKVEVQFFISDQVGSYLNYGTHKAKNQNPSYDMLDSIYTWGNSRGLIAQAAGKEKQRSLAYPIAKSILRKGIIKRFGNKGSKWAQEVVGDNAEKLEAFLTDKISEVLGKKVEVVVDRGLNKMFKDGNHSK